MCFCSPFYAKELEQSDVDSEFTPEVPSFHFVVERADGEQWKWGAGQVLSLNVGQSSVQSLSIVIHWEVIDLQGSG